MKRLLIVTFLALIMSGCVVPGNPITSRSEMETFASNYPSNNDNWYYCGTDAENHHFITRIGGNTSVFVVPKDQIKLTRTVALPPTGVITIYQVYPARNFAFGKKTEQWCYRS